MSMTYVQAIEKAMAVVTDMEVKCRLQELIISLNKKNSKGGKSKKDIALQESIQDTILEVLADGTSKTATEILNSGRFDTTEISVQRITAMLKKLYEGGEVNKYKDGKKTLFEIILAEEMPIEEVESESEEESTEKTTEAEEVESESEE